MRGSKYHDSSHVTISYLTDSNLIAALSGICCLNIEREALVCSANACNTRAITHCKISRYLSSFVTLRFVLSKTFEEEKIPNLFCNLLKKFLTCWTNPYIALFWDTSLTQAFFWGSQDKAFNKVKAIFVVLCISKIKMLEATPFLNIDTDCLFPHTYLYVIRSYFLKVVGPLYVVS